MPIIRPARDRRHQPVICTLCGPISDENRQAHASIRGVDLVIHGYDKHAPKEVVLVEMVRQQDLPVAIVKLPKRGALERWRDVRWSYLGAFSGSIAAAGYGLLDNYCMMSVFGTLTIWHVTGLISAWRLIKDKDNA